MGLKIKLNKPKFDPKEAIILPFRSAFLASNSSDITSSESHSCLDSFNHYDDIYECTLGCLACRVADGAQLGTCVGAVLQ